MSNLNKTVTKDSESRSPLKEINLDNTSPIENTANKSSTMFSDPRTENNQENRCPNVDDVNLLKSVEPSDALKQPNLIDAREANPKADNLLATDNIVLTNKQIQNIKLHYSSTSTSGASSTSSTSTSTPTKSVSGLNSTCSSTFLDNFAKLRIDDSFSSIDERLEDLSTVTTNESVINLAYDTSFSETLKLFGDPVKSQDVLQLNNTNVVASNVITEAFLTNESPEKELNNSNEITKKEEIDEKAQNIACTLEQFSNNSDIGIKISEQTTNKTVANDENSTNSDNELNQFNKSSVNEINSSITEEIVGESTEILNFSSNLQQLNNCIVDEINSPKQTTNIPIASDENFSYISENPKTLTILDVQGAIGSSEFIEILNVSSNLEKLNNSVVDEIKSPELTNRTIDVIATDKNSKSLTEITTPVKSAEILNVSNNGEQLNKSVVDEIKSPGLTNRTIEITETDKNSSLTPENSKTLTEITTPVQEEVVSEFIEILNVSNKLEQLNKSVVDEIKLPELTNRTIEIIATDENSKSLTEITTPVQEEVVSEFIEILNVSNKLEQLNKSVVDEIKLPELTNRTIEIIATDENSKSLTEITTTVQEEVVSESTEILNVSNQLEQRNNSVVNAVEVPEQICEKFEIFEDANKTREEIISEPEIKQNASSWLEQLTNFDEITNEIEGKFEILRNFDNEKIPMSAESNQNSDLCQSSAPKKLSTDEMGEVINEHNSFEKQSDVPNGTSDEKLSIDNKESHDSKIQMYSQMMERLAIAEIDCEKYKEQNNELKKKTSELEQERDELKSLKAKDDIANFANLNEIKELKSQVNKLENIIKEAQKKENKLADDLSSKTQSELQISRVIEEYEKSISSLIAENEKMKKERDTAQMHLGNIEIAFTDVHQKYERCKLIVQTFKDNEETFKHDIGMNRETIAIQEQKYDTLKSHAMSQLEKSNLELVSMKKQHEAEVARLTAQLKRYEIKNISLMESLQQKSKECEQLSAVCDEFIGNV